MISLDELVIDEALTHLKPSSQDEIEGDIKKARIEKKTIRLSIS